MDTETTTEVTAASDEQSKNDAGTEGAQTAGATNSGSEATKTFTQEEVNKLVQSRLAEKERTLKSRHEKDLEAKLAAARDDAQKDLDKLIEERVTARLAEQELAKTRAALVAELGLSEDQAARLQGDTPDELREDAGKIYGALLKQRPNPPVVKTGEGAGGAASPTDISRMTPAEIRANASKLWPGRR